MLNKGYIIYKNNIINLNFKDGIYENILDFLKNHNIFYIATDKIDFTKIPTILIGRGKNNNLIDYLSNNSNNFNLTSKFLDYFIKEIISIRNYDDKIVNLEFYQHLNYWYNIKIIVKEDDIISTTKNIIINNNTKINQVALTKKILPVNGTSGVDGTSGSSGTSGTDGTSGSSGTSGVDGTNFGTSGTSGTSGVDGTFFGSSGTSGVDGTNFGTSGTSGTSGISLISGATILYTNNEPTPITIGGISINSTFENKTMNEMWDMLLYPYQTPSISNLSITGQQQLIEVGDIITSSPTFTWTLSNYNNLQQYSGYITDITSGITILNNINLYSFSQNVTINLNNNTKITQSYRLSGIDNNLSIINSNTFTINSIYPIFSGIYTSSGSTYPIVSELDITGSTKYIMYSSDNINLTFNSDIDDFIWFAIPYTEELYTSWFVTQLNYGEIGGNNNLFRDPTQITISNNLWNNINYNVYISNYRTSVSTITIKRN